MKYFCLPNLAWQDVTTLGSPKEFPTPPYVGEEEPPTKAEFRTWCNAQGTKHCFYSAVEGVNQNARVTVENPAYKLHGLVVDYDAVAGQEAVDEIQNNGEAGLLPRWVSKTFSGKRRAIWEFEAPVMVDNEEIADRFVHLLAKRLGVSRIFPNADSASFKLSQYFEAGHDWQEIKNWNPVPSVALSALFVKAATAKTIRGDGPTIPLEVVAKEVEARWPGRVTGEFVEGSRQPLFWIEDGIDRIGAQVGQFGMLCYSERAGKSFVHWGEILGAAFVAKYDDQRIGDAAEGIWFDGRHYWTLEEDGRWVARSKDDTIMHLKVQGVSARLLPKKESSDAEAVLVTAQKLRTVKAAAPLVHDSRELVKINGERYLNISTIEVMQPAESGDPAKFPWLHEYFQNIFDEPCQIQRDHFLGWLQHYYANALIGTPQQGQAMIIAGPPSAGKTFFNYRILGEIMGGFSDSTNFLLGKTNFNKGNAEVGLWAIDDTRGASTWENKAAFSAAIKKHVANPIVRCEGKGRDSFEIPWKGRIVITCNTNKESLGIVPNIDSTIEDKITCLWWTDKWQAKFLAGGRSEEVVRRELPFFLKWLLDWKAPAYILNDNPRYHVKSYHHPKIMAHVHDSSPAARLTELLELWKENIPKDSLTKKLWVTPGKLRKILAEDPSARDALKEFSRERMASAFEALEFPTRASGNSTEYLVHEPETDEEEA